MSVLLRQAKVIDASSPHNGSTVDILIEGGIIKDMAPKLDLAEENYAQDQIIKAEDGDTLCISAGWVDPFADYREPGFEQKETIATGLAAAAAGGYTDVLLLPKLLLPRLKSGVPTGSPVA